MTRTTRTLTVLAAATFCVAAITAAQPAEARGHHPHHRHFFVIGAPVGAYAYDPAYYGGCYWTRLRVRDGFGWHLRRVQVCG